LHKCAKLAASFDRNGGLIGQLPSAKHLLLTPAHVATHWWPVVATTVQMTKATAKLAPRDELSVAASSSLNQLVSQPKALMPKWVEWVPN